MKSDKAQWGFAGSLSTLIYTLKDSILQESGPLIIREHTTKTREFVFCSTKPLRLFKMLRQKIDTLLFPEKQPEAGGLQPYLFLRQSF